MPRVIAITATAIVALLVCADIHAAAPARTTPIVVKVAHGGFSLADAAVGAVAGAGAVVAAAGVVALLRLRREETNPPRKGDTP
jgi:hypothetical protein